MNVFFYFCLFLIINGVLGGKILVYSPSISFSHLLSNGRIADTLVDAGHEVVMFIPEYVSATNNFTGSKRAKVIRMDNIDSKFEDFLRVGKPQQWANPTLMAHERAVFEGILTGMCEKLMERRTELEVLRHYNFDVAFAEQVDFCGVGVIRYLGISNLIWISTTPLMDSVGYNLGVPQPLSYVPVIEENAVSDRMSFLERANNMWMYFGFYWVHRRATDATTEIFRRHTGLDFPNVREIAANASLCFVNTNEMFDLARPIIHKTIYIGGLGLGAPKALSENISRIMSKGKKGVILFSLGTIQPFHVITHEAKEGIMKTFKNFPDYHFIVKIAPDDVGTRELIEELEVVNVDTLTWLPQSDLLAHSRLCLFLMHGGINGLIESAFRGVPVMVIPVFGDQFRNGRNAERRGMGKVIFKGEVNEETLSRRIGEMLDDQSYKKAAMRMSKLVREVPFTAEERLKRWTQFTIDNGVLDILHVEGRNLNFLQYFNIDVIFVAVVFTILLFKIFKIALCIIFYALFKDTNGLKNKTD